MAARHTIEEDTLMVRMYNSGATLRELSEYFYRTEDAIRVRISKIRHGHVECGVDITRELQRKPRIKSTIDVPQGGPVQASVMKIGDTSAHSLESLGSAQKPPYLEEEDEQLYEKQSPGRIEHFLLGLFIGAMGSAMLLVN